MQHRERAAGQAEPQAEDDQALELRTGDTGRAPDTEGDPPVGGGLGSDSSLLGAAELAFRPLLADPSAVVASRADAPLLGAG